MPISPPLRLRNRKFSAPFQLVPRSLELLIRKQPSESHHQWPLGFFVRQKVEFKILPRLPHPSPIYFHGDDSKPKPDPRSVTSGKAGCKAKGT